MRGKQSIILAFVLATMGYSVASARSGIIAIDTRLVHAGEWTLQEMSGGQLISASPVYIGSNSWGHIPSITIPFTNCDGYWRAIRRFHIPVGATNLVLHISALAVDDRAVIKLNGARITSVGTDANGKGDMQFHDPGENVPYKFTFIAGTVSFTDTTHLRPGLNYIKVIVNNTNKGIQGTITPITPDSPSNFGMEATVTYTP